MNEKFKHVYKIDDIHRYVETIKDGEVVGRFEQNMPSNHEFELPNHNVYDENGTLVSEQKSWFYDADFANIVSHIEPVEKITDFLEYQYANTERPDSFLKHIGTLKVLELKNLKWDTQRKRIIVTWVQQKQKEIKNMPEPKEDKIPLTERLLIIRCLEQHNLFPQFNTAMGQTKKQFEKFIALLLSEKPETVKKALQRVDKILKAQEVTKENQTERVRQLRSVHKHFEDIGQTEITDKIDKLITTTNKPLK